MWHPLFISSGLEQISTMSQMNFNILILTPPKERHVFANAYAKQL